MQSEKTDLINAARLQVMTKVDAVPKKSRHGHSNYAFASEGDIIDAVRPHMVEAGLAIRPVHVERVSEEGRTSGGKGMTRTDVVVTYRLSHISGQYLDIVVVGSDQDNQGKDAAQAMTDARKIALLEAFTLAKVDERQHQQRERDKAKQPDRPQAAQGAPSSPANSPAPAGHPSYRFFSDVQSDFGIQSQDLVWWLEQRGRPHPKDLSGDELQKVYDWLKSPDKNDVKGAAKVKADIVRRNKAAA